MKHIIFFISLFFIFVLCGNSLHVLALLCGNSYEPYNASWEGAKILWHRKNLVLENQRQKADILFAGTSRTMADYSPNNFTEIIHSQTEIHNTIISYNLGNAADFPSKFLFELRTANHFPGLLVLEFSPHMFVRPAPTGSDDRIARYKAIVEVQELFLAGAVKKVFFPGGSFQMRPFFYLYKNRNKSRISKDIFYYAFLSGSSGYGQKLGTLGQVLYRTYFPSNKIASRARPFLETEYDAFKKSYLVGDFNQAEWEAFISLLHPLPDSMQVVVVRPPVDSALYALENQMLPQVIRKMDSLVVSEKVLYIDMNPNPYFSTDLSHIDWYDTRDASRDLALRLLPLVNWAQFNNHARKGG